MVFEFCKRFRAQSSKTEITRVADSSKRKRSHDGDEDTIPAIKYNHSTSSSSNNNIGRKSDENYKYN
jgi:hypothetical protein